MDDMGDFCLPRVIRINGGNEDGADITFQLYGQRFAVSVFRNSPACHRNRCAIQERLIYILGRLSSDDVDNYEYDQLGAQVIGLIMDAGRPIFKAQAKLRRKLNSSRDLHFTINPPTLHFKLVQELNRVFIDPIEPFEAYTLPAYEAPYDVAEDKELGIDTTLPCYSTKAIFNWEMFADCDGYVVSRVLVGGKEMFCKVLAGAGCLVGSSVGRELEFLQQARKLSTAERDSFIRAPQLLGYVRHADTGRVIGFLRTWLPGRRLGEVNVPATPVEQRRKWFGQIRETVDALHARGIVWGDGKPCNVVIDEQDNAWLIDFGGGFTLGWVDVKLAETVEGDNQAISRIGAFLQVEEV